MRSEDNEYYFSTAIVGSVAVTVRARNKTEALRKFKNGEWDDRMDVSIEPTPSIKLKDIR